MDGHCQYPQRSGRLWLWSAGVIFCNGCVSLGSQLSVTAKTVVCLAALHPISAGKSGSRLVAGADNRHL